MTVRYAGLRLKLHRALVVLCSAVLLSAAAFTSASPAHAWSSLQEEWDNAPNGECGNASALAGALNIGTIWQPCYEAFSYDASITSRGWQSVVRAGAYDWCYHSDPYRSNSEDFCWEDYTGDPNWGNNVVVSAANLGYNATGTYVLGEDYNNAQLQPYYSYTGNYSILSATVQINSNANVPWYISSGSTYTVPGTEVDMQTTITHEMGHALGLDHPTQYDTGPGSPVMACQENYGIYNHGSTDDVHGEFWHYDGENSAWGSPSPSPC